jgi:hypothetical protein
MKDYDLIVLMSSSLLRKTKTTGMKSFNKKTVLCTVYLAFLTALSFSNLTGQILLLETQI